MNLPFSLRGKNPPCPRPQAQRVKIPTLILLAALSTQAIGQCSDAGVCSLGRQTADMSHEVSLTYLFGKSTKADDLTFHSLQLGAAVQVSDQSRLSISLPFNRQSGPLGSTTGSGDLTLLWSQTVLGGPSARLGFQIGGKLAIADVNAKKLPQAYQSGLGTNDLLIGATSEFQHWNIAVAYQFSQDRSPNRIDRIKRGDDVLLRIGYSDAADNWQLGAEMLTIKRLQKSSVLLSASGQPEVYGVVPESNQTQVNLVGHAGYRLSSESELRGTVAFPLLNRKVNVDGLTRSLSLSIGFAYLL